MLILCSLKQAQSIHIIKGEEIGAETIHTFSMKKVKFLKIFIYLFGCIGSELQHMGSFIVVCEPLVASSGV